MKPPLAVTHAWIGLGGNLEDPKAAIRGALACLNAEEGVSLDVVSSFYRTAPVGIVDQPDFLNAVARLATCLDPEELLHKLLKIEAVLGRVRSGAQFGPRIVDLDLLLYGEVSIATEKLTVPHPRMHLRRFVLEPLFEIEGDMTLPGGDQVARLLEKCRDQRVAPAGPLEI